MACLLVFYFLVWDCDIQLDICIVLLSHTGLCLLTHAVESVPWVGENNMAWVFYWVSVAANLFTELVCNS